MNPNANSVFLSKINEGLNLLGKIVDSLNNLKGRDTGDNFIENSASFIAGMGYSRWNDFKVPDRLIDRPTPNLIKDKIDFGILANQKATPFTPLAKTYPQGSTPQFPDLVRPRIDKDFLDDLQKLPEAKFTFAEKRPVGTLFNKPMDKDTGKYGTLFEGEKPYVPQSFKIPKREGYVVMPFEGGWEGIKERAGKNLNYIKDKIIEKGANINERLNVIADKGIEFLKQKGNEVKEGMPAFAEKGKEAVKTFFDEFQRKAKSVFAQGTPSLNKGLETAGLGVAGLGSGIQGGLGMLGKAAIVAGAVYGGFRAGVNLYSGGEPNAFVGDNLSAFQRSQVSAAESFTRGTSWINDISDRLNNNFVSNAGSGRQGFLGLLQNFGDWLISPVNFNQRAAALLGFDKGTS